jgi:acyl carrier protein
LALSSPGVSPEVALKVRRIVADHFAIEYERVHPSMTFIEDVGAD